MEDENYKLFIERMEEQDKKLEALTKKLEDVTALNRTLLSRSSNDVQEDENNELNKLNDKLGRCLKWRKD